MHGELLAVAQEVAVRPDIRAVVIYGGERSFGAGADIKEMADLGPDEIAVFGKNLTNAVDAVARLPQPVVAAVTGYALRGGCELALAADFRLVAEDSWMGLPENTLGVIPGAGGTQRLPRLVGVTKAKELIFQDGRSVERRQSLSGWPPGRYLVIWFCPRRQISRDDWLAEPRWRLLPQRKLSPTAWRRTWLAGSS